MKKIKMFVFSIFVFLLLMPVFALEKGHEYNYNGVNDIVGYSDGYYLLKNNGEIIKYDNNDKLLIKKRFNNITPNGIVYYNGNYIMYGESNNLLGVYIVDDNLRVVHNSSLNLPINGSIIKSYLYGGKLYLVTSIEGIISNNKVVVLDKSFNIEIKSLSDVSEFKDAVGSDYYLYEENNEIEYNYLASASINDNNYLVGYSNQDGILKSIIKKNDVLINGDELCKNIDSLVINGKLYVLSKCDNNSKLIIYDEELNIIESIDIIYDVIKLDKFGNKLAIICNGKILTYAFSYEIKSEDSLFGSLDVIGDAKPYNIIKVDAKANSSYEVSDIIVRTSSGQLIEVVNNEFVMPEDSVTVSVQYKELVKNPETVDFIIIFVTLAVALIIIVKQLYSKYKWLK